MKRVRVFFLLMASFMLAGCATVQTCRDFGGVYVDDNNIPVATVAIENYGYYLFGCIPLITGDPSQPNENDFRLFTDTVNVEGNMKMLSLAAEKEKASVIGNVKTLYDEVGSWSLCLVYKRVIFTSAILSNVRAEKQEGAKR